MNVFAHLNLTAWAWIRINVCLLLQRPWRSGTQDSGDGVSHSDLFKYFLKLRVFSYPWMGLWWILSGTVGSFTVTAHIRVAGI